MVLEIKKIKDFVCFLENNGYTYNRTSGSHKIYVNEDGKHISIPLRKGGKDLCLPMVKRLMKEVLENQNT